MAEQVGERIQHVSADPQLVGRLAQLLTDPCEPDARALVVARHDLLDSIPRLYTCLFEPAARVMGDLWLADDCEDWQVTLGMCRLLTLSHDVSAVADGQRPAAPALRSVLVVSQPGETHLLEAALHAELFWRAGWQVRHESPCDDREIVGLVAGHTYDLIDVCLSAAYRRDDWLPRMARTIARARASSMNESLAVLVSGRRFYEDAGAAARVGADGHCPQSSELPTIADAMWQYSRSCAGWQ
jgi:hypothetical protein